MLAKLYLYFLVEESFKLEIVKLQYRNYNERIH